MILHQIKHRYFMLVSNSFQILFHVWFWITVTNNIHS